MALTITKVHDPALATGQAAIYDVQFDNSYPGGGYAVTPGMFARKDIYYLEARQKGVGSRIVEFDYGAGGGVLHVYTALGTEAGGGTDQSTITVRCLVLGPQA